MKQKKQLLGRSWGGVLPSIHDHSHLKRRPEKAAKFYIISGKNYHNLMKISGNGMKMTLFFLNPNSSYLIHLTSPREFYAQSFI